MPKLPFPFIFICQHPSIGWFASKLTPKVNQILSRVRYRWYRMMNRISRSDLTGRHINNHNINIINSAKQGPHNILLITSRVFHFPAAELPYKFVSQLLTAALVDFLGTWDPRTTAPKDSADSQSLNLPAPGLGLGCGGISPSKGDLFFWEVGCIPEIAEYPWPWKNPA